MEAVFSLETPVNFYRTTQRRIHDDNTLHTYAYFSIHSQYFMWFRFSMWNVTRISCEPFTESKNCSYEGCDNDLIIVNGVFSFRTAHSPDRELCTGISFNNAVNSYSPLSTIRNSAIQLQKITSIRNVVRMFWHRKWTIWKENTSMIMWKYILRFIFCMHKTIIIYKLTLSCWKIQTHHLLTFHLFHEIQYLLSDTDPIELSYNNTAYPAISPQLKETRYLWLSTIECIRYSGNITYTYRRRFL
jgi:hypothetical protein